MPRCCSTARPARVIAGDSSSCRRRAGPFPARCASSSPTAKSWRSEVDMAREDKSDKDAKGKKDAKPAGKPPAQDAKPVAKEARAQKQPKADKPVAKEARPTQPARLKVHFETNVVPALMKQFGYKTKMQVPRIAKITLNMGVGEAVADKKIMDNAVGDMQKIAGQKAVVTLSRKSVAGFKIRDGYPVGCMVTLRSRRMYEFLDRLVTI